MLPSTRKMLGTTALVVLSALNATFAVVNFYFFHNNAFNLIAGTIGAVVAIYCLAVAIKHN